MQESYGHPADFALWLLLSLVCVPPLLPVFRGAFVSTTKKLVFLSLGAVLSALHFSKI